MNCGMFAQYNMNNVAASNIPWLEVSPLHPICSLRSAIYLSALRCLSFSFASKPKIRRAFHNVLYLSLPSSQWKIHILLLTQGQKKNPAPPKQIVNMHLTNAEGHVRMLELIRTHVAFGSEDWRLVTSMLERAYQSLNDFKTACGLMVQESPFFSPLFFTHDMMCHGFLAVNAVQIC
jgi:hypothetical protein